MAIIKCPECGNEVSNQAPQCVKCGFPFYQSADYGGNFSISPNDGSDYGNNSAISTENATRNMVFGGKISKKRPSFVWKFIGYGFMAIFAIIALGVLLIGGWSRAGNYKLEVSVNPADGGSISIDPNMESYKVGADVKVTAAANKGYVFEGWSGDTTEKSKSVSIKMSGSKNKELTANFKTIPTFKDSRDGKTYEKVTIGGQTWMAENLNYAANGSKCYENNAVNCEKYGRLYNWATALKACPVGFHLPTDGEWTALENAVGGRSTAGTKLKSEVGWNEDGNGTNDFRWSALPSGSGYSDGTFSKDAGNYGYWWSATGGDAIRAWVRNMDYNDGDVDRHDYLKKNLHSVRCVEDGSGSAQPKSTETAQRDSRLVNVWYSGGNSLTLKSNGTAERYYPASDEWPVDAVETGTWSTKGNKITLILSGSGRKTFTYSISGKTLYLDNEKYTNMKL